MIFPHEFNNPKAPEAERKVFELLKSEFSGNKDVSVYHSMSLAVRGSIRSEYEIDFLIVSPKFILCIELKGGIIKHHKAANKWTQNGHPLDDPIDQAIKNQHQFINRFKAEVRDIQVFWAVCFPDVQLSSVGLPTEANDYNIIDSLKLSYINKYFEDLESQAFQIRKDPSESFPPRGARYSVKQINGVLMRSFGFEPSILSQLSFEEKTFARLFEQQVLAVRAISENPKIIIEGPAGTGKSLIGLHQLFDRYEKGDNVLFLTFNKALAKNLSYQASKDYSIKDDDGLIISTFHSWAKRLIEEKDPEWWENNKQNETFWELDIAIKLTEVAPISSLRYDLVVVDEAQDFDDSWLEPVLLFLGEKGKLSVLIDPNQDIFERGNSFKKLGFLNYRLNYVIRNTHSITQFISKTCELPLISHENCPKGSDVFDLRKEPNKVEGLNILFQEKGLAIDKTIFLYHSEIGLEPFANKKLGRLSIKTSRDGRARRGEIPAVSIKQYKGMEKEIIVIVNFDLLPNNTVKYVAASRAKSILILA